MSELPQIDQVLQTATDRGDVPGVVAMAATRAGRLYQGGFGRRALPDGAPRRCLGRLSNRLTKILSEARQLNPTGK